MTPCCSATLKDALKGQLSKSYSELRHILLHIPIDITGATGTILCYMRLDSSALACRLWVCRDC